MEGARNLVAFTGADTRWVDGLPTALMKPLSGQRRPGHDDDAMKNFWGRLIHRPAVERSTGCHRYHFLILKLFTMVP